jgi:hypothetical protein
MVAQKMDTGTVYFGVAESDSEPMWEPDPDAKASA